MWVDQKKQIVKTDLLLINLPIEQITLVIVAIILPEHVHQIASHL